MYPDLEESRLTEPSPLQPDRPNNLTLSPEKLFYGEKLTNQRICVTNNWNLVIKLNSAEGKFCSERWWENCKNVLGPDESATLLLSKDNMKQLQKSGVLYLTSRYDTFPQQPITLLQCIPVLHISCVVSVKIEKIQKGTFIIHLEMLENLSVEYKLKNTKENASRWQKLSFGDDQITVTLVEKKGKIKFRCSFNGELFHWDHPFPE